MGHCTYLGQIDGSIEFFVIAITGVALESATIERPEVLAQGGMSTAIESAGLMAVRRHL